MLIPTHVPDFGRVYRPFGAGAQFEDLMAEIDEYFQHGVELKPNDVVFDVGANIGAFALHAAKRAGGRLELFCFEPIPPVYEALRRNFAASPLLAETTAHLFPLGLTSDEEQTEAVFHYFKRMPCDTTQHLDEKRQEFTAFFHQQGAALRQRTVGLSTSLRAAGVALENLIGEIPNRPFTKFLFEKAVGQTELRCPLSTLECVAKKEGVKRIDLLKIDVEGAEYDVLRGVGAETWPKIRQVVMEGHDISGRLAMIERLLSSQGFDFIVSEIPKLARERGLNNFILHARRTTS